MKIDIKDFRVPEDANVKLKKWPTSMKPYFKSEDQYEEIRLKHVEELSKLQNLLYANDRYSILLIFQAMDAAGKDSAIKHVMSGINPQGCQVFSFKHPSTEELDHDFLWRTTRCLPERGRIGIFNRSYYEEVLIVRVHPEILGSQRLPEDVFKDKSIWKRRYQSIVGLERHLHRNGTRIVKIFLHVSKEEQRQRFLKRIEDPHKNWKFSQADMKERELWDEYMEAYEACLSAASTEEAPWYVVPADNKKNACLIISQILLDTMKALPMQFPELDAAQLKELQNIRKQLEK